MTQLVNHPTLKLEQYLEKLLSAPDKDILLECAAYVIQHALDPLPLEKFVDHLIKNKETLGLSTNDILEKLEHVDLSKAKAKIEEKRENKYENTGKGLSKEGFIAAWKAQIPERSNELQYFIAGDQLLPFLPPSISQVARRVFGRIDRYLETFISEGSRTQHDRLNALIFRFRSIEEYFDIVSGLVALAIYGEIHQGLEVPHPKWLRDLFGFSGGLTKYKKEEIAGDIVGTDIFHLLDHAKPHGEFILSEWFDGITECALSLHDVFTVENKQHLLDKIIRLVNEKGNTYINESWFVEGLLTFTYVALNEGVIDEEDAYDLTEWVLDAIKDAISWSLETGNSIPCERSTLSHINIVHEWGLIDLDDAWLFPFFLSDLESVGTALSVWYDDGPIKHHAYIANELLEHGWHGFAEAMIFSMFLHLPCHIAVSHDRRRAFDIGDWRHVRRILDYCDSKLSTELREAIRFCAECLREVNWYEEEKPQPQYLELRRFLENAANHTETRPAAVISLVHRHRNQTPEQCITDHFDDDELARLSQVSRDNLEIAIEEMMNFFSRLLHIIAGKRPDDSFKTVMAFGRFLEISIREVMNNIYDQLESNNIRSRLLEDGKSGLTLYAMLSYIRRYPQLSGKEKDILDQSGLTLQKDLHLATLLDDIVRKIRNKAVHDDRYSWKDTGNCIEILLGEKQALKRFIRCLPKR